MDRRQVGRTGLSVTELGAKAQVAPSKLIGALQLSATVLGAELKGVTVTVVVAWSWLAVTVSVEELGAIEKSGIVTVTGTTKVLWAKFPSPE